MVMGGVPAFFMGMPFPTAIRCLGNRGEALVAWSWAINGFASVTASVLGTVLAVALGFRVVVLLALAGYLLASLASVRACAGPASMPK
jgi:hypothetical protein